MEYGQRSADRGAHGSTLGALGMGASQTDGLDGAVVHHDDEIALVGVRAADIYGGGSISFQCKCRHGGAP
jgi:hypothetical protein